MTGVRGRVRPWKGTTRSGVGKNIHTFTPRECKAPLDSHVGVCLCHCPQKFGLPCTRLWPSCLEWKGTNWKNPLTTTLARRDKRRQDTMHRNSEGLGTL